MLVPHAWLNGLDSPGSPVGALVSATQSAVPSPDAYAKVVRLQGATGRLADLTPLGAPRSNYRHTWVGVQLSAGLFFENR
jgi:hypothetical protein